MGRAKVTAGKALIAKRKSPVTLERIALGINLILSCVILLKLYGVV